MVSRVDNATLMRIPHYHANRRLPYTFTSFDFAARAACNAHQAGGAPEHATLTRTMREVSSCLFMLALAPPYGCVAGVPEVPSRAEVRAGPDNLLTSPEGTQRLFDKQADRGTDGTARRGYWHWTGTRYVWVVPKEDGDRRAYQWAFTGERRATGP